MAALKKSKIVFECLLLLDLAVSHTDMTGHVRRHNKASDQKPTSVCGENYRSKSCRRLSPGALASATTFAEVFLFLL